jgi:hypothetical protein
MRCIEALTAYHSGGFTDIEDILPNLSPKSRRPPEGEVWSAMTSSALLGPILSVVRSTVPS